MDENTEKPSFVNKCKNFALKNLKQIGLGIAALLFAVLIGSSANKNSKKKKEEIKEDLDNMKHDVENIEASANNLENEIKKDEKEAEKEYDQTIKNQKDKLKKAGFKKAKK